MGAVLPPRRISFLEGLVKRLSQQLAISLAADADDPSGVQAVLQSASRAAGAAVAAGDSDLPLPPWINDSR